MKEKDFHLDFVCVGPQRTASSWLDRVLRAHPSLCLPRHVKETFFFDRHSKRGFSWYAKMFSETGNDKMLGEVGPTYFECLSAPNKIITHNPECKVIILIRNPIARTFSSFCYEFSKGRISDNFFSAINAYPRILGSGKYSVLCPFWENAIKHGNVFYLLQDDIKTDPQMQFDELCNFLQISKIHLNDELIEARNQRTVPRSRLLAIIASKTSAMLRSAGFHRLVNAGKFIGLKSVYRGGREDRLKLTRPIFEYLLANHCDDIEFLEQKFGRDFSHWSNSITYGL